MKQLNWSPNVPTFYALSKLQDDLNGTGSEGMSFFFVWLRLSTMKQLDWYRNSSYQSKDIAHVQKTITQRIADKVRTTPWGQLASADSDLPWI